MKFKPTYSAIKMIVIGLLTMIGGVLLILFGKEATRHFIDWVTAYFFFVGIFNLFSRWFKPKEDRGSLLSTIGQIVFAFILSAVNMLTDAPINVIVMLFGAYQIFTAGISAITYVLYRKNDIKPRGRFLFDAIMYGLLGISALFSPSEDAELQFLIVGIYLIFLGFTYFRDGLFFNTEAGHPELKRKFKMNLPIVLVALIPNNMLKKINATLQQETGETASTLFDLSKEENATPDLEVLVHVTESGFGAMGHVDICYNGEVISYGSYDTFSEKLGGAIGEGVLFKVDRDKYVDFCKVESNKTLFGYGLRLNDEQKKAIEARIAEIESITVPWQPTDKELPAKEGVKGKPMYSYRLQQATHARLFKFTESKFRSYFVLSTNCVLLADSIIGQAGTDILSVKGFISPGTYQDYLEREYNKPNSLVITRSVY
ncbi:DUF308 domain-containing protein [Aerococcaceae bacterium NML190938]|nr:DUF308 domain-containing protein [Aerococcaceae bacterium NML190938]